MNPYATDKAAKFPLHIAELRAGRQPYPVHVQLVLSDLCNHRCFPAGIMIECPEGQRPIESFLVGDSVIGPDGKVLRISWTGNRMTSELYEVIVDGKKIQATGEHPFLTQDGWKAAKDLRIGDHAVVRMRLRESSDEETCGRRGLLENRMESIFARTLLENKRELPQTTQKNQTRAICERSPFRRNPSDLPVRVRKILQMEQSSSSMGKIHFWPPPFRGTDPVQHKGGESSTDLIDSPIPAFLPVRLRSKGKKISQASFVDGFHQWASNEHHCCYVQTTGKERKIKKRNSLSRMVGSERSGLDIHGGWVALGISKKSRFPSSQLQKSGGVDAIDVPQRKETYQIRGKLWDSTITAFSKKRVELLSSIQKRIEGQNPERAAADPSKLHIAGIQLERSLVLRPIDSVRVILGSVRVYNFACPPTEAYIANSFVVHNCGGCTYRSEGYPTNALFGLPMADGTRENNPNRMIPLAKALEIVADCKAMGVRAIQLTGGGEPTLHPGFADVCGAILNAGIELAVVTNGVAVKDEWLPILDRAAWVRVSIDAGTEKTYSAYRGVSSDHWHRAWRTILNLSRFSRTQRGSSRTMHLGVGFVVTRENWQEVWRAAKMARDHGADSFRISAAFTSDGSWHFEGFGLEASRLCRAAEELSLKFPGGFKVVNMFDERLADLKQGPPREAFCGIQHLTSYVGGDQNVYRCCGTSYNERGLIGSLKGQTFRELWESEAKREAFAGFDARGCPTCQFNAKNAAIAGLVREPAGHDCFV